MEWAPFFAELSLTKIHVTYKHLLAFQCGKNSDIGEKPEKM